MELQGLKDYFNRQYNEGRTEGPTFDEIMEIMVNINESKAVASSVKPKIIRMGGFWGHQLIYNIIQKI